MSENSILRKTFLKLVKAYTDNSLVTEELWMELKQAYSDKKRHYHSLQHLDHLLSQLQDVKAQIKHWNTVLFTLYYHDVVYNAQKSDNEEKSAELAETRMKQLSVPTSIIQSTKRQILATKSHVKTRDGDTDIFTDADLSILGQDWNTYTQYYKNVRKEYNIYPDFVYNPGRQKVLNHFLSMDRIFKTDYFYTRLESKAKQNLLNELNNLSSNSLTN